jgi:hypothetical protein
VILVNVHPAEVQLPDGTELQRARVVLTHRRVRVWREVGRQPELVLDVTHPGVVLQERYPIVGKAMTWPTGDGDLVVTRMRGCGCGSSLKGLQAPTDD